MKFCKSCAFYYTVQSFRPEAPVTFIRKVKIIHCLRKYTNDDLQRFSCLWDSHKTIPDLEFGLDIKISRRIRIPFSFISISSNNYFCFLSMNEMLFAYLVLSHFFIFTHPTLFCLVFFLMPIQNFLLSRLQFIELLVCSMAHTQFTYGTNSLPL